MKQPDWWGQAKLDLKKNDSKIGEIIDSYHGESLISRGALVKTLLRSIVGQQVSVKAADTVWHRMEQLLGDVSPENILRVEHEKLQKCGLSYRKVEYLLEISQHSSELEETDWKSMNDEVSIERLCQIRGVGRWTAEMMLIFNLMRPDVFPLGDIGLIRAIEKNYNGGNKMSKQELTNVAENWKPWRTAATWYLWRSLDPLPVEY